MIKKKYLVLLMTVFFVFAISACRETNKEKMEDDMENVEEEIEEGAEDVEDSLEEGAEDVEEEVEGDGSN